MVKIAICDDELERGKLTADLLGNWMSQNHRHYEMALFSSSSGLLCEVEDGTEYDILLLDIEMPQLDGIELTEKIKRYLPDVLIIFITSYERYVYESFKVQPFRFIPKKYLEQMFPAAIKDAMEVYEKGEGKYLYVENQDGIERIPVRSITYIWHRGKYAYIERTNGQHSKTRKTLKQIYEALPEEDFIWIDRGCICNLIQILKIDRGEIWLTDGTSHPVSRERLTEVKGILRKYWIG